MSWGPKQGNICRSKIGFGGQKKFYKGIIGYETESSVLKICNCCGSKLGRGIRM